MQKPKHYLQDQSLCNLTNSSEITSQAYQFLKEFFVLKSSANGGFQISSTSQIIATSLIENFLFLNTNSLFAPPQASKAQA